MPRTLPFRCALTPATEVEQHGKQVGVVDDAVAVGVGVGVACPEREQHCQQVGVIHTATAVHIPLQRNNQSHRSRVAGDHAVGDAVAHRIDAVLRGRVGRLIARQVQRACRRGLHDLVR